jgi:hypothetical protein
MQLYGWLIGNWDMDVVVYRPDGATQSTRGFVSAGWVLEGRAIQDVFAVPQLFYGTTLRIYDPTLDAWHIRWADPLNQVFCELVGHARGTSIVNEGAEPVSLARLYGEQPSGRSPAMLRWIFTDITPRSFRWKSERSPDGAQWQLQREYFARRVS